MMTDDRFGKTLEIAAFLRWLTCVRGSENVILGYHFIRGSTELNRIRVKTTTDSVLTNRTCFSSTGFFDIARDDDLDVVG